MPIFTDEQRKLFEEPNFVSVATLGKDGTPRVTAVWVDLDGDDILLNPASSRKWLANMRHNPQVALCILSPKNPYFQVNVQGEVVDITLEGAEEHIDKLSYKYLGHSYKNHRPDDPRQIVRIRVKKVRTN